MLSANQPPLAIDPPPLADLSYLTLLRQSSTNKQFLNLRSYQKAVLSRLELELASAFLKRHFDARHMLQLEVPPPLSDQQLIVDFPESTADVVRWSNGIELQRKKTVMLDTTTGPAVILASTSGFGPMVVLRVSLDSLVNEKGESILTECFKRYMPIWGGPDNVEVNFTCGPRFVRAPMPDDIRSCYLDGYPQTYKWPGYPFGAQHLYRESETDLACRENEINLALILVHQLQSFGITATQFFDPSFESPGGITFITRK